MTPRDVACQGARRAGHRVPRGRPAARRGRRGRPAPGRLRPLPALPATRCAPPSPHWAWAHRQPPEPARADDQQPPGRLPAAALTCISNPAVPACPWRPRPCEPTGTAVRTAAERRVVARYPRSRGACGRLRRRRTSPRTGPPGRCPRGGTTLGSGHALGIEAAGSSPYLFTTATEWAPSSAGASTPACAGSRPGRTGRRPACPRCPPGCAR